MKLYKYDSKNLTFKEISLKTYIYGILGVLFIVGSLSAGIATRIVIEKVPVIIKYEEIPFSEDNLKKEINRLNLKFKDVVYAQCIIEGASKTGKRWNNPIFLDGNNFLGLKRAYLRPSTAISWNEQGYCIYRSWRDCIIDYSLFQIQNSRNINTEEEYIILLKEMGYSVNENYTDLIKKIK